MDLRPFRRLAVGLLLSLLSSAPAAAHDPALRVAEYSLQAWSSEEGLPQNTVFAIAQTRDGYLWLGTQSELVRFDGVRFLGVDARSTVGEVASDRAGGLWWAPVGGGLIRGTGTGSATWTSREGLPSDFVQKIFQARDGLPSDHITALAVDRRGDVWAGTPRGLVRWRDGRWETFTTREGLPSDRVNALLVDRAGDLWIGTATGLSHWQDGRIETWTREDGLPDDQIRSLLLDADGTLWIGTLRGLARLRRGGPLEAFDVGSGLPRDGILVLHRDCRGTLLVGSRTGLWRQAGERFEPVPGGPAAPICALHEDSDGTLWAGTARDGLHRLRNGGWTVFRQQDGMFDDCLRADVPASALRPGSLAAGPDLREALVRNAGRGAWKGVSR